MTFSPWDEGKHFVTVGSDKSIKATNIEGKSIAWEKAAIHKMGINDFSFVQIDGNWSVATCSSDTTVNLFPVQDAGLGDATEFNLSAEDTKDYTDKADRQQVGLCAYAEKDQILSHSLNSDINAFNYKDKSTHTIRGHTRTISGIHEIQGNVVSCDEGGRVLHWNPISNAIVRPIGLMKHKIGISASCANSHSLYTSSKDKTVMQWKVAGDSIAAVAQELLTKANAIQ
jgi:hypothetical protein